MPTFVIFEKRFYKNEQGEGAGANFHASARRGRSRGMPTPRIDSSRLKACVSHNFSSSGNLLIRAA